MDRSVPPERKRRLETLDPLLPYLERYSYVGLYGLILACSFGFPFSKTLSILGAGVLASAGIGDLYLYMLVGLAGMVSADSIYFLAGYVGGEKILSWKVFARRGLRESLRQAQTTYRRQGWWAVFSARFTPFVRSVIFLVAGVSRMPISRFLAADLLSALLLVPAVTIAGYQFSENQEGIIEGVRKAENVAAVLFLLVLVFLVLLAWRQQWPDQD
jgi:membrane protein DedA with SNARE-associated domain